MSISNGKKPPPEDSASPNKTKATGEAEFFSPPEEDTDLEWGSNGPVVEGGGPLKPEWDGGRTAPTLAQRPSRKATASDMRTSLEALGLDPRGKRETLFRRLNSAFNRAKEEEEAAAWALRPPAFRNQPYMSFLCFDVEATCEAGTNFDFPNEIIEFPVVLLRWAEDVEDNEHGEDEDPNFPNTPDDADTNLTNLTNPPRYRLVHVDTFHSYIRPTWRPTLTDFCTNLTGIKQSTIDASPTFPEVLARLETWMDSHDLLDGDQLNSAIWVTDGPWDLRDFVPKQLHITPLSPVRYPEYFTGRYLNIKTAVRSVLAEEARRVDLGRELGSRLPRITTGRKGPRGDGALTISGQVEALGLGKFDGRQHSGIDDASNIARVLVALAERDVLIEPNARLPMPKNIKKWNWMGGPGEVIWNSSDPTVAMAALSLNCTSDSVVV